MHWLYLLNPSTHMHDAHSHAHTAGFSLSHDSLPSNLSSMLKSITAFPPPPVRIPMLFTVLASFLWVTSRSFPQCGCDMTRAASTEPPIWARPLHQGLQTLGEHGEFVVFPALILQKEKHELEQRFQNTLGFVLSSASKHFKHPSKHTPI